MDIHQMAADHPVAQINNLIRRAYAYAISRRYAGAIREADGILAACETCKALAEKAFKTINSQSLKIPPEEIVERCRRLFKPIQAKIDRWHADNPITAERLANDENPVQDN